MSSVYLARQPIVNKYEKLEAYEILYLDVHKESNIANDRSASASVVNSVLNKFGTRKFLSENKAFIKIDEKFLMSDLINTIPSEFFILCLFEKIEMNDRVVERVESLHQKGFSIAINDIDLNIENISKYKIILDKLSYFKINIYSDMGSSCKDLIVELQDNDIQVVATKIENFNLHHIAKELGCDFYQGYWFAKPQVLENEEFDSSQLNILKLYNLLIEDTNIDEIVLEFENNHALSIQLLQFINSGAFHFRTRISSIHHILTLVGRQALAQWLLLMIYSKSISKDEKVSPLMLMVKNRTHLMQNLLKAIKPNVRSNALGEAYLVGVLSLIDRVFGVELTKILEDMYISDLVKKALLEDAGTLGMLYKVVRDIEEFNVIEIVAFTKKYKLAEKTIQDIIIASIEEVNNYEKDLNES